MQREKTRKKKEGCVVYIVLRTDNGKKAAREREGRERRKEKDRRRRRVTHHPQPSGLIQSTDDPLFVPVSFFFSHFGPGPIIELFQTILFFSSPLARSVHAI